MDGCSIRPRIGSWDAGRSTICIRTFPVRCLRAVEARLRRQDIRLSARYIGSDRLDPWDRDGTMQKPTIAIIVPGRAGSALGRALRQAGYTIAAIGGRNPDNVRNLAEELGAKACEGPATTIDLADLTILAVPDDVILSLATEMVDSLCSAAGHAAVHLSGAQNRAALRPLAQQGSLRTGVFHPLQTFRRGAEAVQNVAGTYFGIDADAPLRHQLDQVATDIQGHPYELVSVDRPLYRAAGDVTESYEMTLR